MTRALADPPGALACESKVALPPLSPVELGGGA